MLGDPVMEATSPSGLLVETPYNRRYCFPVYIFHLDGLCTRDDNFCRFCGNRRAVFCANTVRNSDRYLSFASFNNFLSGGMLAVDRMRAALEGIPFLPSDAMPTFSDKSSTTLDPSVEVART